MHRFRQGTAVRVAVLCLLIALATSTPQALSFTLCVWENQVHALVELIF